MQQPDLRLHKICLEDLELLIELNKKSLTEKEIRLISPIIRRLLIENTLQRVWRNIGFNSMIKLNSTSMENMIQVFEVKETKFMTLGGANNGSGVVGNFVIYNKALTEEDIKKDFILNKEVKVSEVPIHILLDTPCIIVNGVLITKKELIKYIANKCGGVHFDNSREEKEYKELDKILNIQIAELDSIYFEFLSIIKFLLTSPDINKLIKKLKEKTNPN